MDDVVFLIKGPKRSARLHLDGPFFVIGRAEPFPVFHDDPTLSREHAAVVETPEGYRLKDLGSRNGVVLNGERLASYAEVPIGIGDVFQAGDTKIAVVTMAEIEAARAARAAGEALELGESAESITVDEGGRTGHAILALGEDEEFEGEVTSELRRPLGLEAGRELVVPLEVADDDGWAHESGHDELEDEPLELGEDDFGEASLDDEDDEAPSVEDALLSEDEDSEDAIDDLLEVDDADLEDVDLEDGDLLDEGDLAPDDDLADLDLAPEDVEGALAPAARASLEDVLAELPATPESETVSEGASGLEDLLEDAPDPILE